MDRRAFVTGLGAVLAASLAAEAQQARNVHRIGMLGNFRSSAWAALEEGLRGLGYVEGKNTVIEWRLAEGRLERHVIF